jgi:UDPglucose 6-dehydrogenase
MNRGNGLRARQNRAAQVLIVGAGVVGTATGNGLTKKGHQVSYVDVNPERLASLRAEGHTATPAAEANWDEVDIVMLAVSTPSLNGRIVLEPIESAASDIGHGLASKDDFTCIVVRSTVPPSTTEKRLAPILEAASGKRVGTDFGIAMNPEFLRQRSAVKDFERPWITVIGTSDYHTSQMLNALYAPFGGLIINCTPTEAEMIKYVNNIFNALKISYFNEVHQICEALGIDSNLVGAVVARSAEGMWNPLYGIRGGVPYGGACLPKDTTAFLDFCRSNGWSHVMLEATIEVNQKLQSRIPAATSPDEIDGILAHTIADVPQAMTVVTQANGSQGSPQYEQQSPVSG